MPNDEFDTADSTATLSVEAGGWATCLRYTWTHPEDGEQHGILLMASPDDNDLVEATLIDSWHQKPGPMNLVGTRIENTTSLHATYMETWGWNITVTLEDDQSVRMVMQNVVPEEALKMAPEGMDFQAGPYDAMDYRWS